MAVRIGIFGAGRIGNNHTGHLLNIPGAQIVAAADILPEPAEALAARTSGRACTDCREMLDKEALDAVYVCTPTRGHAEQRSQWSRVSWRSMKRPSPASRSISTCSLNGNAVPRPPTYQSTNQPGR